MNIIEKINVTALCVHDCCYNYSVPLLKQQMQRPYATAALGPVISSMKTCLATGPSLENTGKKKEHQLKLDNQCENRASSSDCSW